MTETGSFAAVSQSPARSIRHRIRYSIGDEPAMVLNLSENFERDIPRPIGKLQCAPGFAFIAPTARQFWDR